MFYKNYMISYVGRDSSSFITKLKYDYESVDTNTLINDLASLNVESNTRLEPGVFDDFFENLDEDGLFYGIPAKVCQEALDEFRDNN